MSLRCRVRDLTSHIPGVIDDMCGVDWPLSVMLCLCATCLVASRRLRVILRGLTASRGARQSLVILLARHAQNQTSTRPTVRPTSSLEFAELCLDHDSLYSLNDARSSASRAA